MEAADLTKSDSAGAVAVGLLDAAGLDAADAGPADAGPEAFATGGGDGGFPGCLASDGLACLLLCSGHDVMILVFLCTFE